MMDFARSLGIQTWVMYSLGMFLIACRFASRRITMGSFRKLWLEEYIMMWIICTFTAVSWAIVQVAENGSNYMSLAAAEALKPQGVKQAIYGSKMTLVMEMLTLNTLWTVKGCLCVMFYRLTKHLGQEHLAVKWIAVYCVVAYLLVVSLFLGYWCKPFSGYWAVPVKDPQCSSYYHHMIFATAFNISADLLLLMIPLRVIPRLLLPTRKKVILLCVLMLGIFNILAAVLNRYYNFSHPNQLVYLRWYVGELATAVYVVNIPATWPVLQRMFKLDQWSRNDSVPRVEYPAQTFSLRSSRHDRARKGFTTTTSQSVLDCESEEQLTLQTLAQSWPNTDHSVYIGSGDHAIAHGASENGSIMKTVEVSQEHSPT